MSGFQTNLSIIIYDRKKELGFIFFGYEVGQCRRGSIQKVDLEEIIDESKKIILTYVFSDIALVIRKEIGLADVNVTWSKACDEIIVFDELLKGVTIGEYNNSIHSYC